MKKIILILAFICAMPSLWAQLGSVKGKVLTGDGLPASGVVVSVWQGKALKYETLSSEKGEFQLDSIPAGKYRFNIANNLRDSISQSVEVFKAMAVNVSLSFKAYAYPAKNETASRSSLDDEKTVIVDGVVMKEKERSSAIVKSEPMMAKPSPKASKDSDASKFVFAESKGSGKSGSKGGGGSSPKKGGSTAPMGAATGYTTPTTSAAPPPPKPTPAATTTTTETLSSADVVVIGTKKPRLEKGKKDKESREETEDAGVLMGEGDIRDGKDVHKELSKEEAKPALKAGTLTAGEVHDFSKWNLWKDITENDLKSYTTQWQMLPEKRYTIQVANEKGFPIVNALVQLQTRKGLTLWTARTDNTGKAELWANLFTNDSLTDEKPTLRVDYLGKTYSIEKAKQFHKGMNVLKIAANCQDKKIIDIAFVVDATGSMGDEIEYLKTELYDVINLAKDTLKDADLRLGSVFYRDHGDAYVSKFSDFNNDLTPTIDFIKANGAGGGGDTPEAVEEALKVALRDMKWRNDATSRMLFLILDA
ncbi:MAG: hypothetical protein ACKVTZ_23030, partial [Bacteroidia bacterium]